jgi:hypothetical protein
MATTPRRPGWIAWAPWGVASPGIHYIMSFFSYLYLRFPVKITNKLVITVKRKEVFKHESKISSDAAPFPTVYDFKLYFHVDRAGRLGLLPGDSMAVHEGA